MNTKEFKNDKEENIGILSLEVIVNVNISKGKKLCWPYFTLSDVLSTNNVKKLKVYLKVRALS